MHLPTSTSTINKAREILIDLKNKNTFIKSIYLWGSIATGEYVEGKSDIDSIAFVEEDTYPREVDRLNEYIQEQKSLPGLKINMVYKSELNNEPQKSGLTKHIHPTGLLYDFPFWVHVCGEKYQKEDFVAGGATVDEIISIMLKAMRDRFLPVPIPKDYVYFAKALARIIYFINQKRLPLKPFRYDELINDSQSENIEVAKAINELKLSNWDNSLLEKNIPIFVSFLSCYNLSRVGAS